MPPPKKMPAPFSGPSGTSFFLFAIGEAVGNDYPNVPMSQQTRTQRELASVRDTVESIWVAIVLAFVLRAFVLEAFVIPTGSMAPRLYGEHLELRCPACGREFAFGKPASRRGGRPPQKMEPSQAVCPNCGFDSFKDAEYVAGGDRVLVMKYLYRFQEPKPWDVIVFKNPQDNEENYIKRLIGLPGETIEIVHGDVFVRQRGEKKFRIRRKDDLKTQSAMWQVVFDNDFQPAAGVIEQANLGRGNKIVPPRWTPVDANSEIDRKWNVKADAAGNYGRILRFAGTKAGREARLTLRAQHPRRMFLPRYGYNMDLDPRRPDIGGVDVISDLKLEGAWRASAASSKLVLTLSSFEFFFRGEIAGTGEVRLLCRRADESEWRPMAPVANVGTLANGRGHVISLRHVDQGVSVWIDGQRVATSIGQAAGGTDKLAAYPMDYDWVKARMAEARRDEVSRGIPVPTVMIAASGAPATLDHVKLSRDVYYTSPSIGGSLESGSEFNFIRKAGVNLNQPGWGTEGHAITLGKFDDSDLDQFFVLGDNSPESLDGRLWVKAAASLRLYDDTGVRGDPNVTIGDIDWPKLLTALRRPTTNERVSAAAYVFSRMSREARQDIRGLTRTEVVYDSAEDEFKLGVVAELNRMIASSETFDRRLWNSWGAKLPQTAAALAETSAAGKGLGGYDLRRLNRIALQAALPDSIGDKWRVYQLGTVPRYSLIGKAVFVYWPSGFRVPFAPSLPIIPNVGRMRLIR